MGGFSGGGLNPPKFFLTPFRKCLTPLVFCFTPWQTLVCHFMPLPKHQEWHIVYDLHPTQNFPTPPKFFHPSCEKNENPPLLTRTFRYDMPEG